MVDILSVHYDTDRTGVGLLFKILFYYAKVISNDNSVYRWALLRALMP